MSHTNTSDGPSRAYRAMLLVMSGECTAKAAAERYGISGTTVYAAIRRHHDQQRNIWPEDEVTL